MAIDVSPLLNQPVGRLRSIARLFALVFAFGAWWTAGPVHGASLVPTNSVWRYFKGTQEASSPTNLWRGARFSDSGWASGRTPFYYDTAGEYTGETVFSDMRNQYT
jgi:hypothetical protein